jgi:serine/threonine protein kinase
MLTLRSRILNPGFSVEWIVLMFVCVPVCVCSRFKHPNIVRFIGICFYHQLTMIILELLEGGDLKSFLRQSRPSLVKLFVRFRMVWLRESRTGRGKSKNKPWRIAEFHFLAPIHIVESIRQHLKTRLGLHYHFIKKRKNYE